MDAIRNPYKEGVVNDALVAIGATPGDEAVTTVAFKINPAMEGGGERSTQVHSLVWAQWSQVGPVQTDSGESLVTHSTNLRRN